jgi:5-oxoprolinase (ATP-hydrolysing) subunit C
MAALGILRAGPVCTLQDAGRAGWLRFGVTPAGPMDWIAHSTANLMARNPAEVAAIEIGPGGIEVTAEGSPLRIGLSAQGFTIRRDRNLMPTRIALTLQPGERLSVHPGHDSLWAYLAVAGGFAIPGVMGSLATHLRSGIGPLGGGVLQNGQSLATHGAATDLPDVALIEAKPILTDHIRFVPGPQDDRFSAETSAAFTATRWRISPQSDRMGYRLTGPPLVHVHGHDIVSDGIALGAIQVPGDGFPIVLMADRQPTGGYPKIGTVIRADLPRLAQTRPGQSLQFMPVSIADAVTALRAAIPKTAAMQPHLRRITMMAAHR